MASFTVNGQLIAAPIASTRRNYSPPSSSRELRSNSPSPRFQSLICSSSRSPSRKTQPPSKDNLLNSLGISLAVGSALSASSVFLLNGGGGGNFGGFRGGGGGGGFWRNLFSFIFPVAIADEERSPDWDSHGLPANIAVQLNKLSGTKKYKISDIDFFDRREQTTVDSKEDSFFDIVSIKPGEIYTKSQLQRELEALASSGMFDKLDFQGKTKPDGTLGVTISFADTMWQPAERFRCINVGLMSKPKQSPFDSDMTVKEMFEHLRTQEKDYKKKIEKARPCLLSEQIQREVMLMLRDQRKLSARVMQRISEKVVKWYHDQGFTFAKVVNYGNLNSKELVCEVVEGDITRLDIKFRDKLGNVVEGKTQTPVVHRQIPKQLCPGNVLDMKTASQALQSINSLGLFSNIEITPRPDEKHEGGLIVEVNLTEAGQKSAQVNTDWNIVPGSGGLSKLTSLDPGGSVSFEHRNIKGLNRTLTGTLTTSKFLNPEDDLSFSLDYEHPYLDGVENPRNRILKMSMFNTSKLSPVFTGGPGFEEAVPPMVVDRVGMKANIAENFTPQSKFTYGLVLEEIKTRDENGKISATGQRLLPDGGTIVGGPPTSLSGTGTDHLAFLQANITRDNTKFVNGAIVGDRNIFQVDQGLGIGSKSPLFNRHQLTLTKFIPLMKVEEGPGKPQPPVLVLNGHYGGCVGDLPSYDAFALGGPNSVRGYLMGELGAARNKLEVGAELRIPVKQAQLYAFAEHGTDLGSSKDVKGNPTAVYGRRGHGSSYGVGVKVGQVRAEYAVDHNCGTGSLSLRFGERY